jgi:hypothetical protein
MSSKEKVGVGCFVLFLLPFCGVGIFAGYQTIQRILQGSPNWEETILLAVFALVFGGVGFGLLAALYFGKKKQEKEDEQKSRHPDRPWMWREDWAQGQIRHSSKREMLLALGAALFVLLVSLPATMNLHKEVIEKDNKVALIGYLFPLIGLGALVWAIRATIRWRRFGTSVVQMSVVPGLVGGPVVGTLQTGLLALPEEGFLLTLRCIHRQSRGSGKSRSVSEKILWQEEHQAKKGELFPGPTGTALRFAFEIPYDCRETDEKDSNNRVFWNLQAQAKVPGVDYEATFDLPVFRTEQSSETVTTRSLSLTEPQMSSDELQQVREQSKIRVGPAPGGGKEIFFPAARNPGTAAGMTFFFAIWSGVDWLLIHLEAPLIFPIVFGFFGVLILYGVLALWFGTSRVVIESGEVRVKKALIGAGSSQFVPVADIKSVETNIGMQQGGQKGTPYYDIVLTRHSGSNFVVGRFIKNKREMEWIVQEIRDALANERR